MNLWASTRRHLNRLIQSPTCFIPGLDLNYIGHRFDAIAPAIISCLNGNSQTRSKTRCYTTVMASKNKAATKS
ncbi:MAG: hypothetical protein KZQ66_10765, partial [Candidatus Thiodiazotropha sp. (ex Lucinoma aequizonata)]|nr:hypothetical protein [Candidatus Thiodiazotropha sp. (ex Lucinoma aequizonata)]